MNDHVDFSRSGDRELRISRVMSAPRERVFETWTRRLPEWWGPHGTTTPVCEMELRPGGVFRTVLRAPDGSEYPARGVFLEVVLNERVVFTDAYGPGWTPRPAIFFTTVATFDPLPHGRTCCTTRALHWTRTNREKHERLGFHQGWTESLERLAALLAAG